MIYLGISTGFCGLWLVHDLRNQDLSMTQLTALRRVQVLGLEALDNLSCEQQDWDFLDSHSESDLVVADSIRLDF